MNNIPVSKIRHGDVYYLHKIPHIFVPFPACARPHIGCIQNYESSNLIMGRPKLNGYIKTINDEFSISH